MNIVINLIKHFMQVFDQTVLEKPTIPSPERKLLRLNLINEELNELEAALINNNIEETADALADLIYVVVGCAHECGLGSKLHELVVEVHRSNLSKACNTMQEAIRTVALYNISCTIREKEIHGVKQYLVFRNSDNKLLKSINYSPADIKGILER
jgi:predicted HAD superfamily Cof-like phosphohydrolase